MRQGGLGRVRKDVLIYALNLRLIFTWLNSVMDRDSRYIARRLEADGWTLVPGGKGSHRKYRKTGYPMIILPFPKKDLPIGTARNIAKAARWIK